MTVLAAVLILLAIVAFGAVAVVYTRWRSRRGEIVRFPELAAERPNDLNFGFAIILGFVLVAALQNYQGAQQAAVTEGRALTTCLLYTSPSPRDGLLSRMPSSA